MEHFLSAHINCLERQVESYSAAQVMNQIDVEELMSLFVSLAGELEKSLVKEHMVGEPHQAALADFKRLATAGGKIRSMATQLRKEGHVVAGLDPFVRSVIRCRDIAQADEATPPGNQDEQAEMPSQSIT